MIIENTLPITPSPKTLKQKISYMVCHYEAVDLLTDSIAGQTKSAHRFFQDLWTAKCNFILCCITGF